MGGLRVLAARVQSRLGARPLCAAAAAGIAAAQPHRRVGGAAGARVQHRGLVRDEHELAELRRRADDEPPDPDGRPRGTELRVGRRRAVCRGGADPGPRASEVGHDRELLGRPHPRHDPVAAPSRRRLRARSRQPGDRPELPRLHACLDAAGRDAVDPGRPRGEPGGDQGNGRERRRLLQRQRGPSVREPERVHRPPRDLPAPDDPVRPHLHLRPARQGPAPGVGALHGHVCDLDRGGRARDALGDGWEPERPVPRRGRRQHGGQGGPLRHRRHPASTQRRRRARRPAPSTPPTTASRRSAAPCPWST